MIFGKSYKFNPKQAKWIRNHNKRGFGIRKAFGGYFKPIGYR